MFGSTNPITELVQVVLSIPVPPERERVIDPSSKPEQETSLTTPLVMITSGSLTTNVVSLVQPRLSETETV